MRAVSTRTIARRRSLRLAAGLGAGLALTVAGLSGCSGSGSGSSSGTRTTSSATVRPFTPPPAVTSSPSVGVHTLPAVQVGKTAELSGGVSVRVVRIREVKVSASGVGQIAGPGVAVLVEIRNATKSALNLSSVVVNASYGSGTPAVPNTSAPADPVTGSLAPGRSAQGTYVFALPKSGAATLRVEIASGQARNVVVFRR